MICANALCIAAFMLLPEQAATGQDFTLAQAMSAPFASDLVASPKLGRLAWIENQQGKRNIWLATPNSAGQHQTKRLTAYNEDDGQEMYDIAWTPDAEQIIYVRVGDSQFPD